MSAMLREGIKSEIKQIVNMTGWFCLLVLYDFIWDDQNFDSYCQMAKWLEPAISECLITPGVIWATGRQSSGCCWGLSRCAKQSVAWPLIRGGCLCTEMATGCEGRSCPTQGVCQGADVGSQDRQSDTACIPGFVSFLGMFLHARPKPQHTATRLINARQQPRF